MGGSTRTELWPGWRILRAQARSMSSPNAGWPMAVAAWMHGAVMGGATVYHGKVVDKPLLGPSPLALDDASWTPGKIRGLMFHLFVAGLVGMILALCILIAALWL